MENIYNRYAIPGVEMNTWIARYEEIKEENKENSFITEAQIASMVNESFGDNTNEVSENTSREIPDLIPGMDEAVFQGIIKTISPVRHLTSKKGRKLDLQRIIFIDEKGNSINLDIWNRDIQGWNRIREEFDLQPNDLVEVQNVSIKEYRGNNTSTWTTKTILKPIKKGYKDVSDKVTPLKDIKQEGSYRIQVHFLFVGEPQLVGQNNTPLQKIVISDDWETVEKLCIWREELPYVQGDKVDLHVNVSSYQNQLNFNYDNEYEPIVLSHNQIDMTTANMEEIEELEPNDTVNIQGKIIRIFNPIPYDKGHITTWTILLEGGNEIDFTMFQETGRNYSPTIGTMVDIYDAIISWDDYSFCQKLIHGYDTLLSLKQPEEEETSVVFTSLADIQRYADEDIYIDIQCHIIKKNNTITYQRQDNTASTVTHLLCCDNSDMKPMVVWGDQQFLIQYGGEYNLYNVRVKENYDTNEFEIHCDNRTRVEEAKLGIKLDNLYTLVDELSEDLLSDLIAVEGTISNMQIFEYPRCPSCNGRLTETMRGYYCDSCKTEPAPRMLLKIEATVGKNRVVLWDEVAHSLIDQYVNKEAELADQIEKLQEDINEKPHKYCGTTDYNEKTDTIMLNASIIV